MQRFFIGLFGVALGMVTLLSVLGAAFYAYFLAYNARVSTEIAVGMFVGAVFCIVLTVGVFYLIMGIYENTERIATATEQNRRLLDALNKK